MRDQKKKCQGAEVDFGEIRQGNVRSISQTKAGVAGGCGSRLPVCQLLIAARSRIPSGTAFRSGRQEVECPHLVARWLEKFCF
jgi:hypothetical protein